MVDPADDPKSERPAKRLASETQTRATQARRAQSRAMAQKIQRLIQERGWIPADLARHAGINRDVVSTTLNGKSFPSKASLEAMARALGVKANDLSDVYVEAEHVKDDSSLAIVEAVSRPGHVWLTVNKLVRASTAAKIHMLLIEDNEQKHSDGG